MPSSERPAAPAGTCSTRPWPPATTIVRDPARLSKPDQSDHRTTSAFPLAFSVAAQHYLLRRSWDEITGGSGRALLIDHVHLNDRGGAMVTDLASQWLSVSSAS